MTLRARLTMLGLAALALAPELRGQAAAPVPALRADPLNLDLERIGLIAPDRPRKWLVTAGGFDVATDSTVAHTGTRSVRSRATATSPGSLAELRSLASMVVAPGQTVRVTGHIRTEDVRRGFASLWLRVDGPGGRVLASDSMTARRVTGTTPWTEYDVSVHVDSGATGVSFGGLHAGDGTVWFDSFSLDVGGKQAATLFPEWSASPAQVSWVRAHAIPIATTDPAAPLDDLRPFGAFVGGARVVALGEGTHGTADFFRLKQRLVQYLVTQKGFGVFAIEAHMPETRRLNEYVLTGKGDARTALAGLYFPYWNSREVLDIVEWIREYNASGKGRVELWGFDMQVPGLAMDSVRAFVASADPSYLASLDSAYGRVRDVQAARRTGARTAQSVLVWQAEAARVLAHLEANRASYLPRSTDSMQVAWALQNARIVLQGAQSALGGTTVRDSNMAQNVAWIDAHHPRGTRMIVSSLDRHVQRVPGWMGIHMQRRFADTLRVVGMAFGGGTYTSNGPRGLAAYPADEPEPGSVESVLRAAGLPIFALDLRGAARVPAARWLTEPHELRIVGTNATDNAFATQRVASDYDMLIYVDHTRASTLLEGTLPRP
jgi:erythromycin esterase